MEEPSTTTSILEPIPEPIERNNGNPKEYGIERPKPFDGDRTRIKAFIQQCNIYLNINERIYNSNKLKVAFVLSLMNDKEAEKWKTHFINRITGPDLKINFPRFSDFLKIVEFDFKPTDVAGDAMNKLELLRQGGRPVEALITDFRNLCADAELEDKSASDN